MVHIIQCWCVLAFLWVLWQHLTWPLAEMVLKAVPCGLFPSPLHVVMCFSLLQGSVTARYRLGLHLPTWLSNCCCLENTLLCPLSAQILTCPPKSFLISYFYKRPCVGSLWWFRSVFGHVGWINPDGSAHLNSKRKKPFYVAKARYFRL